MTPFATAAAAGQLALPRCTRCGAWQYPPRPLCRVCLHDGFDWRPQPSLPGELLAVATVMRSYDPGVRTPSRVGLVRLFGEVTAVCFAPAAAPGPVTVTAALDGAGRPVLTAC